MGCGKFTVVSKGSTPTSAQHSPHNHSRGSLNQSTIDRMLPCGITKFLERRKIKSLFKVYENPHRLLTDRSYFLYLSNLGEQTHRSFHAAKHISFHLMGFGMKTTFIFRQWVDIQPVKRHISMIDIHPSVGYRQQTSLRGPMKCTSTPNTYTEQSQNDFGVQITRFPDSRQGSEIGSSAINTSSDIQFDATISKDNASQIYRVILFDLFINSKKNMK